VWREDDSGNAFLLASDLDEADARVLVAEYERRGHKQYYSVRQSPVADHVLPLTDQAS
jgi:hypothetical protein